MRRGNRGVRGLDGELNSARGMYMRMYFIFAGLLLSGGVVYREKRAMA